MKLYGSLQNRMEEDRVYTDEIKVGTGMTEYSWSDRTAYEVVEVLDQKHVKVRRYDHEHVGDGCMDNNWKLISNPNNAIQSLERRGDYWYWTVTCTAEQLEGYEDDFDKKMWVLHCGFDPEVIKAKGKQTKRSRAKVSFGVADYYYDYEF